MHEDGIISIAHWLAWMTKSMPPMGGPVEWTGRIDMPNRKGHEEDEEPVLRHEKASLLGLGVMGLQASTMLFSIYPGY